MSFLSNVIKKFIFKSKSSADNKSQKTANIKTNEKLISQAKNIIDENSSSNFIIKNLVNESSKKVDNPFSDVSTSNTNNSLNKVISSTTINTSPVKVENENTKDEFNVDLNKTENINLEEKKDNNINIKQEEASIEVNSNKQEDKKLESENTVPNIENQELLLEKEYNKLKLDLSELEDKKADDKKFSNSIFVKVLLFLLKFLSFRWLFSIKLLIIFVLGLAVFIVYVLWNLPDYTVLDQYKPNTISRVYSSDGYIISELGLQNRSITSINNIPKIVKDAFISAEDKTFYTNYGFDFKGILRAIVNDTIRLIDRNRSLMGASTITQQVVKNLLLNHDRTLIRKAKEAILTIKLEQNLTKDRILELYLNEIYLGMASYGVTTAALNYFNKSLSSLTLPEAAFLAILPRSPNGYNPVYNYNGAKVRRDWVIERMLEDGKITKQEAEEAIATPILLNKRTNVAANYSSYAAEEVKKQVFNIIPSSVVYSKGLIVKTTINEELQKYAYNALRSGIEKVDKLKGYRGPITNVIEASENTKNEDIEQNFNETEEPIWLYMLNKYVDNNSNNSLDDWQLAIVTKVNKSNLSAGLVNGNKITLNLKDNSWASPNATKYGLKESPKRLVNFNAILKPGDIIFVDQAGTNEAPIWQLKQIPKVNGAMLVMNPVNGHVLAMQGGFSYQLSQFNRATQALRQPGSSFKPFVYLAALEKGMTPATLVLDAPYTSQDKSTIWRPKNNSSRYAGYVTMRNALEVSRNLASIRIANFAGLDNISNVAKRLGIYNTDVTNFSEVIGSKETTLLKMVRAYSVVINGGKGVDPVLVNEISNREGRVIYKNNKIECLDCNNIAWNNQKVPEILDTRETIIDPKDAYLLTNMLVGVVNRGIGWRAKISGYDIGGKTGTTNDSKDLWYFGFTPQLVVGVYIGEDTPTSLEPAMASVVVTPIFTDFASKALPLLFDKLPFRIPDGIEMSWIDAKTGKQVSEKDPGAFLESFREDNMPKANNNLPSEDNNNTDSDYGLY